jgi:hypothetical protein
MIATSGAIFLFSGYQRWRSVGNWFVWPAGTWWSDGSHYVVVPLILPLSALSIELDADTLTIGHTIWNGSVSASLPSSSSP